MDTDLAKGCFGLVFICVHLRPSVVRLGGTVDENRNGVPLALSVLLSTLRIFVDERHSPEKKFGIPTCSGADFDRVRHRQSRSAGVTQA